MISISSDLLQSWVISLLWPLTRILGMIAIAPVFSERAIPNRIKLGFGVVLTLIILPTLPPMPVFDIFSPVGLLLLVQQILIGFSIGFCMRLVFAAIGLAGQMIGMSMGLGFAVFFDPMSNSQNSSIAQFLSMLALLIFLSLDGHLMMVTTLAESFISLPITNSWHSLDMMAMASWGETIFSVGLQLAMPAIAALLITNMALGILTRTAPQLNIFGIGFPVTLSIGFLVLALALQGMLNPITQAIDAGFNHIAQVMAHPETPKK